MSLSAVSCLQSLRLVVPLRLVKIILSDIPDSDIVSWLSKTSL